MPLVAWPVARTICHESVIPEIRRTNRGGTQRAKERLTADVWPDRHINHRREGDNKMSPSVWYITENPKHNRKKYTCLRRDQWLRLCGRTTPVLGIFLLLGACGTPPTREAQTPATQTAPSSTRSAGTFTQVSAGGIHTCGVKRDGTVACWGLNKSWTSQPAHRALYPGQRGRRSHLRGEERRNCGMLGVFNKFGQTNPLPRPLHPG